MTFCVVFNSLSQSAWRSPFLLTMWKISILIICALFHFKELKFEFPGVVVIRITSSSAVSLAVATAVDKRNGRNDIPLFYNLILVWIKCIDDDKLKKLTRYLPDWDLPKSSTTMFYSKIDKFWSDKSACLRTAPKWLRSIFVSFFCIMPLPQLSEFHIKIRLDYLWKRLVSINNGSV